MSTEGCEHLNISIDCYEDVVIARQKVRKVIVEMGYSLLDQTRVITAVSELARNMVVHAGNGTLKLYRIENATNKGITCTFADNGPGIPDIQKAMQQGFSTVNSLGLGLGGSKNLSDEFDIKSTVGKGTTVTITKWLHKKK